MSMTLLKNATARRLATLAVSACALGALSAPMANAAVHPMTQGSGNEAVPNLRNCTAGMYTTWDNGNYTVQLHVSVAAGNGAVGLVCNATLHRNLGGWGQLGPAYQVSNGGSAVGSVYSDNGTLAYVCATETDYSPSGQVEWTSGQQCSATW
ncbi:hypothetical protein GXW82_14920 [Streptacidiphilus sp. 4-A2]|nr:hypothetical protein [Streptacidiphilus sp. 4-A2]